MVSVVLDQSVSMAAVRLGLPLDKQVNIVNFLSTDRVDMVSDADYCNF